MNGRRGHTPVAENTGGFVGRRQNGKGAAFLATLALPIARDHVNTRIFQRAVQLGQEQRLAGSSLTDHSHHLRLAVSHRCQQRVIKVHARQAQHFRNPVMGFGLVIRKGNGGSYGHAATLSCGHGQHQRSKALVAEFSQDLD